VAAGGVEVEDVLVDVAAALVVMVVLLALVVVGAARMVVEERVRTANRFIENFILGFK
jgi:hypothetical protein